MAAPPPATAARELDSVPLAALVQQAAANVSIARNAMHVWQRLLRCQRDARFSLRLCPLLRDAFHRAPCSFGPVLVRCGRRISVPGPISVSACLCVSRFPPPLSFSFSQPLSFSVTLVFVRLRSLALFAAPRLSLCCPLGRFGLLIKCPRRTLCLAFSLAVPLSFTVSFDVVVWLLS